MSQTSDRPEPSEPPEASKPNKKNSCKFCQAVYPTRKQLFAHLPHCHDRREKARERPTDAVGQLQEQLKALEEKMEKQRLDGLETEEKLANLVRANANANAKTSIAPVKLGIFGWGGGGGGGGGEDEDEEYDEDSDGDYY